MKDENTALRKENKNLREKLEEREKESKVFEKKGKGDD